jgi:hypothetical protein
MSPKASQHVSQPAVTRKRSRAWVLLLILAPWLSLACATGRGAAPIDAAAPDLGAVKPAVAVVPAPPAAFEGWEWPEDSRLRSAGLRRDRGSLDGPGQAPEAELAALRAHFAAVDSWLDARTDASLELALDRLAAARGRVIEPPELVRTRAELADERVRQRERLRAYADVGRFPQTPDLGGAATPIFVDAHDTACAVGHLMRVSGNEPAVARIAQLDNFVYVQDATVSPVADWVLTSGLTIEEAAVVQPTYTPPSGDPLTPLTLPGGALEVDGLRIDNFQMRVLRDNITNAGYPGYAEACFLNPEALGCTPRNDLSSRLAPDPSLVELALVNGAISTDDNGGEFGREGYHSLFLNASNAGGFPTVADQPHPGLFPSLRNEIVFDVSAVDPAFALDSVGFSVTGFFWEGAPTVGPDILLSMLVTSGADVLGVVEMGSDPDDFFYLDEEYLAAGGGVDFDPTDRVTVTVAGYLGPDALWNSFSQSFHLVPIPEPSTALSFGLGLVVLGIARRRRRSH